MDRTNKNKIEVFHNYFLSASEEEKESIRNSLTPDELTRLEKVEARLDSDGNIEMAALETGLVNMTAELEELQFSYYLWRAEQYVKGEKNVSIEKLLSANNWLFKEAIAFEADEEGINKSLVTAIRRTEREALRKQLLATDLESGATLLYTETSNNVVPLNGTGLKTENEWGKRRFLRYAAAALVIAAISTIIFLVVNRPNNSGFSQKETPPEHFEKEKPHFAKYLPDVIAKNITIKALTPEHMGFAGRKELQYNVSVQHIEQQIETLKKWYAINDAKGIDEQQKNKQIDSMLSCINTYIYYKEESRLILKLGHEATVDHLIILDQLKARSLFIQLKGQFYEIKPTKAPLKLIPATDSQLIESLQKIVFQNS